jgi:hypothetical protein
MINSKYQDSGLVPGTVVENPNKSPDAARSPRVQSLNLANVNEVNKIPIARSLNARHSQITQKKGGFQEGESGPSQSQNCFIPGTSVMIAEGERFPIVMGAISQNPNEGEIEGPDDPKAHRSPMQSKKDGSWQPIESCEVEEETFIKDSATG